MISFGALLGANTRFYIYTKLHKYNLSNELIILIINIFSSFCLGLCMSIMPHISSFKFSYQLGLFFSVGFLGSLSTFSTFINDLFNLFSKSEFFQAFKLFFLSMTIGIISLALGFLLGNQ